MIASLIFCGHLTLFENCHPCRMLSRSFAVPLNRKLLPLQAVVVRSVDHSLSGTIENSGLGRTRSHYGDPQALRIGETFSYRFPSIASGAAIDEGVRRLFIVRSICALRSGQQES